MFVLKHTTPTIFTATIYMSGWGQKYARDAPHLTSPAAVTISVINTAMSEWKGYDDRFIIIWVILLDKREHIIHLLQGDPEHLLERVSSKLDLSVSTITADLEKGDETSMILALALLTEHYSSLDFCQQLENIDEFGSKIKKILKN